jgi:DNA-binding MarR family transcriptional regulator
VPQEFAASRDDVDAVAAWTVIRAGRELARRLATELSPMELTPVEFGVLVQLATAEELSQAELSRAVGVRPQSMTALVAALGARGLLERQAEPGRGRLSRLTLTSAGRELLSRAFPVVLASNAWFGPVAVDDDATGADVVATALRPLLGSAMSDERGPTPGSPGTA